jgi:hypothetical protein
MAGQIFFSSSDTSPTHRSHSVVTERMVLSCVSRWHMYAMGKDERRCVLHGVESQKTLGEA